MTGDIYKSSDLAVSLSFLLRSFTVFLSFIATFSICDQVLCDLWHWRVSLKYYLPPHVDIHPLLLLPGLLSSPVVSSSPPSLPSFFSLACNDLVASGSDRKPNALVQVDVIDRHKKHLFSPACTEIVEVRPHAHVHTSSPWPLVFVVLLHFWVTGSWFMCSLSLSALLFLNLFFLSSDPLKWNRQWASTFYFLWQSTHLKELVMTLNPYNLSACIVCVRGFLYSLTFNASFITSSVTVLLEAHKCFFGGGTAAPVPLWNAHLHTCMYTHTFFFFPHMRANFPDSHYFLINPVEA